MVTADESYKNEERRIHALFLALLPHALRCDVVLLRLSDQGLLHRCKLIYYLMN